MVSAKETESLDDRILKFMGNPAALQPILQLGINKALLAHKRAGNSVYTSKERGEIVKVPPEDIPVEDILTGKKDD